MTSKKNRARAPKEINKKFKKKTSVLVTDKVEFVDYKDVNLLNRFVSDRSKIRNRRVTGNTCSSSVTSPTRSRTPVRWRFCRTPSGSQTQPVVRRATATGRSPWSRPRRRGERDSELRPEPEAERPSSRPDW